MTPNVWLYIQSYSSLRDYLNKENSIVSLVELEKGAFFGEATVDTLTFVFKKSKINNLGVYYRLESEIESTESQEDIFLDNIKTGKNKFLKSQNSFDDYTNHAICYFLSSNVEKCFKHGRKLSELGDTR